ncbi:MAG TPA: hypothetical protein VGO62_05025 [Myxococcota bacterium]
MGRSLVVGALVTAAMSLAACHSADDAPEQQWSLVQNHFYIERMPKSERDMVKDIAFIDHEDAGKIGIDAVASRFRFVVDTLKWQRRGNTINMRVLQSQQDRSATFRAWRCKDKAPFELCLELKNGDRTMRYYSKNDWIIERASDVEKLAAMLPLDPDASPDASAD